MAKATVAVLVAKNLDNPKKAAAMDNDGDEFLLGTIMGRASGISARTDAATGEVNERMTGFFEGVPADPKRDTVQAGACFLPGGFHEMMLEQLRDKTGENGEVIKAPPIDFAVEVITIKAPNKAGYVYKLTPLMELAAADPLESIRAQIAKAPARAQIEAPKPDDKNSAAKKKGGKK